MQRFKRISAICFRPHRWPFCSREPRSHGSSSQNLCYEPVSESSATSCRAVWLTSLELILLTTKPSREVCWARWVAAQSRLECRIAQWTLLSPQIKDLVRNTLKDSFRAHPGRRIPQRASHPSQSQRCPLALCMLRTSWSGAWELNINSEPRRVCWRDMWEHAL